ncbi:unnamed protein product [Meganyctiphanes norvegica]|uniref:1-alkyl-2-acetylglycerophosphocholine esterase n=1 Tax=Meganyctiphanes norvegica TaxID=48144 RepID=A0AAV2QFJ8_MEGNR
MAYALYTNGVQHLPLPSGEYGVGITDVQTQGEASLLFRLFYPVDPNNSVKDPAQWVSWHLGKPYSDGVASFIMPKAPWLLSSYFEYLFKSVKIPAVWQTPPAAGGVYPVIVVSHGVGSHRTFQSTFCCELASHGFIVVAIEHSDGSASATFRMNDSDTIWFPFMGFRGEQFEKRVQEVLYTVDALKDMNNGKINNVLPNSINLKAFENKLDISNIVLTGHSYGAATTLAVLAKENNPFKAGVALDPWMYSLRKDMELIANNLTKPILILCTERFNYGVNFYEINLKHYLTFSTEKNLRGANLKALHKLEQLNESKNIRFLTMRNTIHEHQNDVPYISGWLMWWVLGGTYKVPIDITNQLQNKLFITFVNKHLGLQKRCNEEYETFLSHQEDRISEGL